jgi:hypothetical protein
MALMKMDKSEIQEAYWEIEHQIKFYWNKRCYQIAIFSTFPILISFIIVHMLNILPYWMYLVIGCLIFIIPREVLRLCESAAQREINKNIQILELKKMMEI